MNYELINSSNNDIERLSDIPLQFIEVGASFAQLFVKISDCRVKCDTT